MNFSINPEKLCRDFYKKARYYKAFVREDYPHKGRGCYTNGIIRLDSYPWGWDKYAVAMHELGHHLTAPKTREELYSCVYGRLVLWCEAEAWIWARTHARYWSPHASRKAFESFGSYERDHQSLVVPEEFHEVFPGYRRSSTRTGLLGLRFKLTNFTATGDGGRPRESSRTT